MSESKLPQIKPASTVTKIASAPSELELNARAYRRFGMAGVSLIVASAALFVITDQFIIASLLLLAGAGSFMARQMARKSLQLTSGAPQTQLGSTEHRLSEVKKNTSKAKYLEHVEAEGNRVAIQGAQLLDRYQSLKKVLGQKFSPSEMTYARYFQAIEATCLSCATNIEMAEQVLKELDKTASMYSSTQAKDSQTEPQALNSRKSEWESRRENLIKLIDLNEKTLLELDLMYSALDKIVTQDNNPNNLDDSIERLKELAERTKQYSQQ